MANIHETGQTIEITDGVNPSVQQERNTNAALAAVTANILGIYLGEPVSQLTDAELRAYSYTLKWGLGLSREDRVARMDMIRDVCETGEIPETTGEILSAPGAVNLIQSEDRHHIRRARAISAVRETIKAIAPRFLSSVDPVPEFFMEGYRCAINGGPREQILPSTVPEPDTHVVYEAKKS